MSFSNSSPGFKHSSGHRHHPDLDGSHRGLQPPAPFLRAAGLTCLPDRSCWVTASSGAPQWPNTTALWRAINIFCELALARVSDLTSHSKYRHSMPMNHRCPRTWPHHTCPWLFVPVTGCPLPHWSPKNPYFTFTAQLRGTFLRFSQCPGPTSLSFSKACPTLCAAPALQ